MFNTKHSGAEPPASETQFRLPGHALLDRFTELSAATPGVNVYELAAGALIRLRTRNSEYRVALLDPAAGRVLVEGGPYFSAPTEAVLCGSGCGGALLRLGWIGVGLQLEFHYPLSPGQPLSVVTSPIEGVWLE